MEYTWDGAGNPMAIAFSGSSCPSVVKDKTVTYIYDATSRLTNETIPDTSNTTWTYDWVGNRGRASDYNAVDEYKAGNGYIYDKLGNVEHKPDDSANQHWNYYYSGDNLMNKVEAVDGESTETVEITWDADGHRIQMVRDLAEAWTFLYDPTASVPAVLLAEDYDGSTTNYTFNVREPGGELLASFEPEGANKHYYHFDGLGSTVLVTNGSGTVSDAYAYDAWGNALAGEDGLKPYQYVGKLGYYTHSSAQGDALANLLQLGVRFYDPEIGRFTQRDPIRKSAYAYVAGRPVSYVDPSGLTHSHHETDLNWDTGAITCTCSLNFTPFEIPTDVLDALAHLGLTLYMDSGHVSFGYTKPLQDKCKDPGHVWPWSSDCAKEQKRRRGKYYDGCDNSCAYLCQYGLGSLDDINAYMLLDIAKEWKDKVDGNYDAECK
jgi:RHS repeat-associated protein